jgi:hypothetical protein
MSIVSITELRPATDIPTFYQIIKNLSLDNEKRVLFRGQSKKYSKILPKVLRNNGHKKNEGNLIRELISVQPEEFSTDSSFFDRLVRAQHFGLPTRLLDVTLNPLTALYFSCENHKDEDGQVLCFSFPKGNRKFFDSDAVSVLSNYSNLSDEEKKSIARKMHELYEKSTESGMHFVKYAKLDKVIRDFNRHKSVSRLVQFVREEKSYFANRIMPLDLFRILAVQPKQSNKRITAQSGNFLLYGIQSSTLSLPSFGNQQIETNVITVPYSAKTGLLESLDLMGINRHFLFPEIEQAAGYISAKYAEV